MYCNLTLMFRLYRNRRFQNAKLLQLTTIGAKSGQERTSTAVYFEDGPEAMLIVASAGGSVTHPAWFFNLAKNPDKVWAQVGSRRLKVRPETLSGDVRAQAWERIKTQSPVFATYEVKTDRELPIIRLTPA